MYLITGEGLGAPDCVSEFLDKVRNNHYDYKKLLLLARVHPFPGVAASIGSYPVTKDNKLIDCVVQAGSDYGQVIAQLRQISDDNLNDEIKAEDQLWARVTKALEKVVDQPIVRAFLLKPEQLRLLLHGLYPLLLDPKKPVAPDDVQVFRKIGMNFASMNFAKRFPEFQDIRKSEAADAHFVNLGYRLTLKAISDPAFRSVVRRERERRKRSERAEERQIQQQIRYLRRMHVIPGL
jgi:hypothetical protein